MIEKGFNLKIKDFKEDIVKVINQSGLPATSVRQTLDEVMVIVREIETQTIQQEEKKFEQEKIKCKEEK